MSNLVLITVFVGGSTLVGFGAGYASVFLDKRQRDREHLQRANAVNQQSSETPEESANNKNTQTES